MTAGGAYGRWSIDKWKYPPLPRWAACQALRRRSRCGGDPMADCRWYAMENRAELQAVLEKVPPADRAEVEREVRSLFLYGPTMAGSRRMRQLSPGGGPDCVVTLWHGRIALWFSVDEDECVLTLKLALPTAEGLGDD